MLRRCGFGEKWIGWIRSCVFAGNLSVLLNGSPTGEINIHRGLKQGDPLAPFPFLLVVEGFSGVMRKAVELSLFKGFSIGRLPVVISHLQYVDDTLCIGEASLEYLWTLKAILRGFEMAYGLKVNFWKSGLIGVNVALSFWKWQLLSLIVDFVPSLLFILGFLLEQIRGVILLGILSWIIFGRGYCRAAKNARAY
ncbi:hypothetical protein QL285_004890 [Trifolium repens]|nr:hypothetical protein QL285_004890 [Trifolium repens]